MPVPYTFQSRILTLAGGRGVVLQQAAAMLRTTNKPRDFKPKELRAHVLEVLFRSVVELLRAPLYNELESHLESVALEHEMFEGEKPDDSHAAERWQRALDLAELESLSGEVESLIGHARLSGMIEKGLELRVLVDALLSAPVADVPRALSRLELTEDDVAALGADLPRTEGQRTGNGHTVLERLAADFLIAGGDMMALTEALFAICTAYTHEGFAEALEPLALADSPDGTVVFEYLNARTDLDTDKFVDGIAAAALKAHTKHVNKTANVTPPRLEKPARTRKTRAVMQTDVTEATATLIAALCDHSGATEAEVSEAVGCGRQQMNNYRHRRTALSPSPEQSSRLEALGEDHLAKLTDALDRFRSLVSI